jgi:hypothetical protein
MLRCDLLIYSDGSRDFSKGGSTSNFFFQGGGGALLILVFKGAALSKCVIVLSHFFSIFWPRTPAPFGFANDINACASEESFGFFLNDALHGHGGGSVSLGGFVYMLYINFYFIYHYYYLLVYLYVFFFTFFFFFFFFFFELFF